MVVLLLLFFFNAFQKGGFQISIHIWLDNPFPYASQDPTKMISGEGGELQPIFIELQPVVEESIHNKLGVGSMAHNTSMNSVTGNG